MYLSQIEAYRPRNEQESNDKRIIYHFCQSHPHNVLLRTNEVAHLTSSGFIMNRDLTRVLVIYHKIYQAWGWTGGHVDGDKDLLEVALKEAREETGLKRLEPLSKHMMSIDVLPVWGHEKNGSYVSAHLHYNASYILIADEKDELILNEEETDGVQWIDADEIETYSDEADLVVVYKKLIDAARAYDVASERALNPSQPIESTMDMASAIKETAIPIALHETQSAYYKAKLAKEVVERSGKAFGKLLKDNFKKSDKNQ